MALDKKQQIVSLKNEAKRLEKLASDAKKQLDAYQARERSKMPAGTAGGWGTEHAQRLWEASRQRFYIEYWSHAHKSISRRAKLAKDALLRLLGKPEKNIKKDRAAEKTLKPVEEVTFNLGGLT